MKNKDISDWNTKDFTKYLQEEHLRRYGIEYQPFGKWAVEQGHVGRIIGTAKKEGTHSKEFLKDFIDACFNEYKPTALYPGISFGFMLTYKKQTWQRVELAYLKKASVATAESPADWDEVAKWL
ncbi:hypothetical protein E1Z16_15340 [Listeria monocytogenes]|uniref:Uncharacterized protein n=1 Tax=Listeria monocytogenes TaxID=1639 RepID=A0A9P1UEA3_LISMN|nr:hypothetical protein [Listeria monocytogenes]EAC2536150.1 hypothetical protein [Listeria monocytogenes]EAC3050208.1 hypothetical protein [Listeria monocytogenes]EAC3508971.1 hypothetical protein [Listeria monocytogenes]EAC3699616.1 hypothetical protein [Listeria monocytogenes]EAC3708885.1 hypothetical protein [Listeria monocytogenes]